MTKAKTKAKRPVLILDTHRGIYFGYLISENPKERSAKVEGGRHCFYFPVPAVGNKGVYGLATVGPGEEAKLGPPVTMTIYDVAKVVECEKRAVKQWTKIIW